jgi:hypothetical protein
MPLQDYLSLNAVKEAKYLFEVRCRMLDVRTDYAGGFEDLSCPLCQLEEESIKHLMYCLKFNEESDMVAVMTKYEEKILVSRIIHQRFLKRKTNFKEGRKMTKSRSK